jgi:NADH-quinone oxidoreductase subunit L
MTSFYMFRLYFLVFSGNCRADENVRHHIHESPAVMTVPLVLLALLSFAGGLVGTPWRDWFGELLGAAPELHVPWVMMALGSGAFIIGLLGAVACYAGGVRAPVVAFVRAMPWLHRLVKNKYYVDEIYGALFVRPLRLLARFLAAFVDKVIIDGLMVGGVARLCDAVGYLARRLQNGDVQRYVSAIVIGAALLLWMVSRPPTEFSASVQGGQVSLSAEGTGKGAHRHLRYCWKLDGASECRSDKPNDTLPLTNGPHKITLRVEDADWGTSASRTLEVHGS